MLNRLSPLLPDVLWRWLLSPALHGNRRWAILGKPYWYSIFLLSVKVSPIRDTEMDEEYG